MFSMILSPAAGLSPLQESSVQPPRVKGFQYKMEPRIEKENLKHVLRKTNLMTQRLVSHKCLIYSKPKLIDQ